MFSNSLYAFIAPLEIKGGILDCYILHVLRWLIIFVHIYTKPI